MRPKSSGQSKASAECVVKDIRRATRRLAGDTARAATSGEGQDLRRESRGLKECVADLTLENRLLKKA